MLSQIKYFRQRLIKYLENHSVTETAIRFRISRKTVYKWKNRTEVIDHITFQKGIQKKK